MNVIQKKIIDGILELFPEAGDLNLSVETCLGEISGYDSMAAVNLQTYLEEAFRTTVFLEILNEGLSIGELALFIEDPKKMTAARQKR